MATKKQNTTTTTATTNSTASQDNVQLFSRLDRIIELLEQLNADMPLKGIDTSRFVK